MMQGKNGGSKSYTDNTHSRVHESSAQEYRYKGDLNFTSGEVPTTNYSLDEGRKWLHENILLISSSAIFVILMVILIFSIKSVRQRCCPCLLDSEEQESGCNRQVSSQQ